ncbi:hypothetical protein EsDP_00005285 [Epichloe bromicola]|uniref:Elongin-A n=1 Tax=Epichloe bromicola TaxID=79588 RepID=A0ABQ0CUN6_9HYPO
MPVKSLFDLATATCVKNLKGLQSIGDFLPYEAVRHILLKIESAHQLRQVELSSPQIQGETGEIWLRLIEKDFPMEYKTKAYKPQSPDKWHRVWEKYKKDHDTALQESESKLKNALAGLKQDKEKNTSRIIERKLLPKSIRLGGGKRLYSGNRDAHSNALAFNAGSRTKTINGASVMRKVRREVKEIATIHGALSRPIRGPTKQSQLHKAPEAMVNDYRRANQPRYRSTVLSPEPSSAVAEHEARATFISDSDEENEDDMFDDETPKVPPRPIRKPVMQAPSTSLMTKKPSTSQASPSTARASRPSTGSSPAKRGSGLLSNKFRGTGVKVMPKPSSSSSPSPLNTVASKPTPTRESEPTKTAQHLPRTQTSPPPTAASGPSSPPAAEQLPLPPSSESVPRKRKAVDIFMRRPKKRTG